MAVTCSRVIPDVIRPPIVELSRPSRTGALFPVRISARSHGITTCEEREIPQGPSCIFVGPIETASQETLEALYRQARDSYYSGSPLILDDMFDRVELKLRWYGSQYVVKYPRCSLRRQSTYADAQEDPSQVFALASIWLLIFGLGGSVLLVPIVYTISQAYRDAFISEMPYTTQASSLQFLTMLSGILYMALGSIIGYPIALASTRALGGLWTNDLVALKGACPNCGEEVFAFVRSDQPNHSLHRTECHIGSVVNEGKLVPVEVIFRLLSKRLEEGYCKGESGFILDGIPRTKAQAISISFPCWNEGFLKPRLNPGPCYGH